VRSLYYTFFVIIAAFTLIIYNLRSIHSWTSIIGKFSFKLNCLVFIIIQPVISSSTPPHINIQSESCCEWQKLHIWKNIDNLQCDHQNEINWKVCKEYSYMSVVSDSHSFFHAAAVGYNLRKRFLNSLNSLTRNYFIIGKAVLPKITISEWTRSVSFDTGISNVPTSSLVSIQEIIMKVLINDRPERGRYMLDRFRGRVNSRKITFWEDLLPIGYCCM